jgi:hypothetical protein
VLLLAEGERERERGLTLWYPSINAKTGVSVHFMTLSDAI